LAETTFYLYPASNDGPYTNCSPSTYLDIDDPYDSVTIGLGGTPTQCANFNAANDGASYRNAKGSWGLTSPTSGVSINWIRLHVHKIVKVRQGGSWVAEPKFVALVRPGGSSTYYASSSRTIVNTGGNLTTSGSYQITDLPSYNANTSTWGSGDNENGHVYWQWSTNPVTALAWTVSDLQNLLVAVACDTGITTSPASIGMAQLPPGSTGSNFDVRYGAIYVEVNANTAAASIEEKRSQGSAYLRVQRDPTAVFDMQVPLGAGRVGVGDVVPVTHRLGPTEDGGGWGRKQWERSYGIVLDKQLDPTGRSWRIRTLDMRQIHTRLWFPAITDLAYTEEGQGIPYLDQGSGRTFDRKNGTPASTYGYVLKQEDDTLYAEVPHDKEKWTPEGLAIFRQSYAVLKNNSFSQGSGSSFTDWTQGSAGGGGTFAESTTDYIFDATGLRRAAKLTTDAASGSELTLSQGVGLGADGSIRVHVIHKKVSGTTTTYFVWRLQRSSDSYYWNESSGAWQSGAANNALNVSGTDDVIEETHSGVIPCDTSAATYTLTVYALHTASDEHSIIYYYANIWQDSAADSVAAQRPPFVTTTAYVFEGDDLLYFDNPPSGRCYDPEKGSVTLTLKAGFDHEDLTATTPRYLLTNYVDASNYDALYFEKVDASSCRVVFDRVVSGSSVGTAAATLTGDDRPSPDSIMKIGARWQATDGELDGSDYDAKVFVSTDGRTPVTGTGTLAAGATGTANLYFGATAGGSQIDGYLRDLDISPYVLTDNEIYARLGV
jgi:hypothetical protein